MLWHPGTQSGSTAEAEASSLRAEALQMDLWGPRGCPGQRVLQPRGPTGQHPAGMQCSGRVWRWWVDAKWYLSTADRRPRAKEAVAWNHLQPCAGEKSCAGLVDPPSHLPSQPPSLTHPCSVPACGAGALPAGRDRAAGWGEDLLTGRETRHVALILAKFSASPRQGQGCSHRISTSLSQKC